MDYKKYNDYELIYMIRENDEQSNSILFEKYQPLIQKIARQFYQNFSNLGYQLDDFIQEARIGFYRAICNYREDSDILFYTFVVLCVKRGLISFCREISNSKKNISLDLFDDISNYDLEDKRSDIHSILQKKEIDCMVKKLLLDLPSDVSYIMELKWNGFSHREISILLDIPFRSVELKCRIAIRKLRMIFQKYEGKGVFL